MGNAQPLESEIAAWLPAGAPGVDMVAVATQESSYKPKRTNGAAAAQASPVDGSRDTGEELSDALKARFKSLQSS